MARTFRRDRAASRVALTALAFVVVLTSGCVFFAGGRREHRPPQEISEAPVLRPRDFQRALSAAPGSAMTQVRLEPAGPELLISNSPEDVYLGRSQELLMRASPNPGAFRFMAHHRVTTPYGPARLSLVFSSGADPFVLGVGPNSLGLPWGFRPGGGPGPEADKATLQRPVACVGPDPCRIGARALHEFLSKSLEPQPPSRLLICPPRSSVLFELGVPSGHTSSFLADFFVSPVDRAGGPPPSVEVALYASWDPLPLEDPVTLWESGPVGEGSALRLGGGRGPELPVAPAEAVTPPRTRGRFPAAQRKGEVRVSMAQVHWLDLAGPLEGPHAHPLPGEYETATGDGAPPNLGNYGVVYDLDLHLENAAPLPRTAHLVLCAAGGAGSFMVAKDGRLVAKGEPVSAWEGRHLSAVAVPAGATSQTRLTFSLPPGSPGAQRLYLWPDHIPLPGE